MVLPPDRIIRKERPLIGVVGPCAAGKSTLIQGLNKAGIQARHIAQEHSYVKDMWQRLSNPIYLVYLDVSYPITLARRKLDWSDDDYNIHVGRLIHARAHADLYINTDLLTPDEVQEKVFSFLKTHGTQLSHL